MGWSLIFRDRPLAFSEKNCNPSWCMNIPQRCIKEIWHEISPQLQSVDVHAIHPNVLGRESVFNLTCKKFLNNLSKGLK